MLPHHDLGVILPTTAVLYQQAMAVLSRAIRTIKKTSVRPVTIEGQKFEIHQDPSQTLPERLWTQFGRLFFSTFQNSRTKRFRAAIMANIGLRNSQEGLGLDAAQFRVPHPLRSTKSTTAS